MGVGVKGAAVGVALDSGGSVGVWVSVYLGGSVFVGGCVLVILGGRVFVGDFVWVCFGGRVSVALSRCAFTGNAVDGFMPAKSTTATRITAVRYADRRLGFCMELIIHELSYPNPNYAIFSRSSRLSHIPLSSSSL